MIARPRYGCVEEASRYWMEEEAKRCKICEEGLGNLKHWAEDCRGMGDCKGLRLEELMKGRNNEKVVEWLEKLEKRK